MSEIPEEGGTLPLDQWEEHSYERGQYGPDDRAGVDAVFEHGSMTLAVRPVRYECREGEEEIRGLTTDLDRSRQPVAMLPDVAPLTAFATVAEFRPYSTRESDVVCVARDADDALAAALWLAAGSTDDRDLQQHVRLHRGEGLARSIASVSDDDVVETLFADEPDRCILSGRPTSGHRVELPYRYVPELDGCKRTPRGVPRIPSTIGSLVGVVSHTEWEAHDLEAVEFDAALERLDPGTWTLNEDVLRAVGGANAANFAFERLGAGHSDILHLS